MSSLFRTAARGVPAVAKLLSHAITRRRIPVRVSLLVTKRCNLRCFYCYAKDTMSDPAGREPGLADLQSVIDQVHAAGCRWINILGGEPLMRDDIGEVIDYAGRKNMLIELTTNGYFVAERLAALKKVDHLCISLDGDKEANDRSRGKGSFERIVAGIECAVDHGLKVRVHATLCKRTMARSSLDYLSEFCRSRRIRFNYSENGLPGIETLDPDFRLSPEETIDFYRGYRRLKKQGFPIASSDAAVEYAGKWPLADRTTICKSDIGTVSSASYYPCKLGRNQCFVNSDWPRVRVHKKMGIRVEPARNRLRQSLGISGIVGLCGVQGAGDNRTEPYYRAQLESACERGCEVCALTTQCDYCIDGVNAAATVVRIRSRCAYHKRTGETFVQAQFGPPGMCGELYHAAYSACLAVLYSGKPRFWRPRSRGRATLTACCPAADPVRLTVTMGERFPPPIRIVKEMAEELFKKTYRPVDAHFRNVTMEVAAAGASCPKGYKPGDSFSFDTGRRGRLCPAAFAAVYPALRPLALTAKVGGSAPRLRIQCPDHAGVTFEVRAEREVR